MRKLPADAEFEKCPDCGNATALVVRDRKQRKKRWRCQGCRSAGIFLGDDLSVMERPADSPHSRKMR